jgi:hypothetical protein
MCIACSEHNPENKRLGDEEGKCILCGKEIPPPVPLPKTLRKLAPLVGAVVIGVVAGRMSKRK